MQDTCKIHRIRILITNPPKFDNKPPVTREPGHTRDTRAGHYRYSTDTLRCERRQRTQSLIEIQA